MVDRTFNNEAITAHNYFRSAHGCPNIVYDAELAKQAQSWASHLAKTGNMQHSKAQGYGENLAYKWSSSQGALSGKEATQMWYDEIQYHNFKGQFQPKSGHFTQVIWKSSKKAGFGRAVSADGKAVYVVGRYTPAGNVQGQFTENVPKSTKPVKSVSDDPVTITEQPAKKKKRSDKHKCAIL